MTYRYNRFLFIACLALVSLDMLTAQAQAQTRFSIQSITTAQDEVDTVVNVESGFYFISNGTEIVNPNNNEINLFHSFATFGLTNTETAIFEHSPGVQNIIGRVGGGRPSNIDGQISVGFNGTSSANLYLLNPSGILFGNNASLNLGGSFSASTATGIVFGDALFDALGTNAPNNTLVGNPTGYVFGAEQISPIVNEANLAVPPGQSLTLLGGQAINSGTLSAPAEEGIEGQIVEGQILVAAVPGENLVRVSQVGSLLSLEFETVPDPFAQSLAGFTPSTLPELLTGPGSVATDLTLGEDGSLSLSGSPFVAELGTAVLDGTLDSLNTTIFIERTIVLNPDLIAPEVTVEAIQSLQLADLIIPRDLGSIIFNSSGSTNIGPILSRGNNVEWRSQGAIDTGDITTSVGSGDAGLVTLESQASITTGDIDTSSDIDGASKVKIIAGTSITTGDITATGGFESGDVSLTAATASVTTGDIDASIDDGEPGSVVIEANRAITTGDITTAAFMVRNDADNVAPGNVDLIAGTSIVTGKIDTSSELGDAGNVILDPPGEVIFSSIDASSLTGTGGDVTVISTESSVRGIDVIDGSNNTISTAGATGNGRILITHGGSATVPFDIGDASFNGTAGAITTGGDTLADGDPNDPFLGSFTQGNIQLIATDVLTDVRVGVGNPTICVQDCTTPDGIGVADDLVVKATEDYESIFLQLEDRLTGEFVEYLRPGLLPLESSMADGDVTDIGFIEQVELGQSPAIIDLPTAQKKLIEVQRATGKKPALIYAVFGANQAADTENNVVNVATSSDPLELMLITAEGEPVYVRLNVTREEAVSMAQRLRRQVSTPSRANLNQTYYLAAAQQLYQWLVAPLQAQLNAEEIDTISFITDAGLRSTPLAALHDGQDFIIQNYNVGLMPSLSLTDLTYQNISNVGALLAGTSTFLDQAALPGVPLELDAIASQWSSTLLRDEAFVLDTLKGERQKNPSGIIHLATHGEFNVGDLSKSHLYLHNQKLALTELRTLGLHQPSVELLTLSACQTALGNRSAELGFSGFAVLAGAKTSIASLWNVSDEASAGLMIEFYRQLQYSQPTIKAEALRKAQLAMIRGDISVAGGWLKGLTVSRQLPVELAIDGQQTFSHPYYWAAFSLVGSPW